MINVTFSGQALRDLDRILRWLRAERGERAAASLVASVERFGQLIAEHPAAGRITRRPDIRVLALPRAPYQVFYKQIGDRELRIMHLRHAARRPLGWL